MQKTKYDTEIDAEILELNEVGIARLSTIDGVSSHKKFVLVEFPSNNEYPYVIFQNLSDEEKLKCCEMLEKLVFQETYLELEENSIRIKVPKVQVCK
ncbi:hypothetical protein [Clostridium botulinum]|uniref:hypothetical protein n=1 Tax=Clostridium botulinum TaxID=1491 RepID=UPI0013F06DEF|nr:hypothetical protein [Clostridium botulinum]MBY6950310.1 hypothetical protein [Clostridium botulinum]MCR1138559.1 hypothetical protein [Clostridium botulinum]NEZ80089.1 hypothetical protein [Clostridium botulinum]NFA16752.1 hypothetical protein [Clostridium botulinum]NFA54155.1 hypothetical protein [Clostridium botulinum]